MALEHGQAYCHETIVFQIGGAPMLTLTNIRWKKSRIKGFNYGTGIDPVSYGTGHKNPVEGSFQISKSDLVRLEDGQPDKDITNIIPFDIPVTNALVQKPRQDTLKNVLILGEEQTSETGNTDIMSTIEFQASDVKPK